MLHIYIIFPFFWLYVLYAKWIAGIVLKLLLRCNARLYVIPPRACMGFSARPKVCVYQLSGLERRFLCHRRHLAPGTGYQRQREALSDWGLPVKSSRRCFHCFQWIPLRGFTRHVKRFFKESTVPLLLTFYRISGGCAC